MPLQMTLTIVVIGFCASGHCGSDDSSDGAPSFPAISPTQSVQVCTRTLGPFTQTDDQSFSVLFSNLPDAFGGAILEISYVGDFDGDHETGTILNEVDGTIGTFGAGLDCGPNVETFPLFNSEINAWNQNSEIAFMVVLSDGVNPGGCASGDTSFNLTLSYDAVGGCPP